jgi:hypothetical protein
MGCQFSAICKVVAQPVGNHCFPSTPCAGRGAVLGGIPRLLPSGVLALSPYATKMDRSLLLADIQKQELDRRHQAEIEKRKLDWKALSIDRKKWWEEWQAEFGETRQRQRSTQGSSSSGSGGGRAPSPALPCPGPEIISPISRNRPCPAGPTTRANRSKTSRPNPPIRGLRRNSRRRRPPTRHHRKPVGRSAAARRNVGRTGVTSRGSERVRRSRCIICALSR